MSASREPRSIAIVGAGLSGLICARVLQLNDIPVTVYEREPSATSRQQGGSLDMHPESGFKAIQIAQLVDEFQKIARPEGQDTKVFDKDGTLCHEDTGPDSELAKAEDRPEADRTQLRKIMLDSLKPDTVKWDHGIASVSTSDNKATITFTDSSIPPAVHDFVVGADGTWSRVRPTLSSAKPEYTGVTLLDIFLHDVDEKYPDLAKFVGRGSVLVLADDKGVMPQRNSESVVRVYAAFRKPLSWFEENGLKGLVDEGEYTKASEVVVKEFDGWMPEVRSLLTVPCHSMALRPLFAYPSNQRNYHTWECNPNVTIIGDAAHVMVVFSGDGANHAMWDGADLGLAIAKNISADDATWQKAIKGVEAPMQRRAWSAAQEAMENMDMFISNDEPAQRAAALFKRLVMMGSVWSSVKSFFTWAWSS